MTGKTAGEHLKNLDKVLNRLEVHGLTIRRNKCNFMQNSIQYLGFVVDGNGRHVSSEKTSHS